MPSQKPTDLPYPPRHLLQRIGPMDEGDPLASYRDSGPESRELLERFLPDDWSWQGKRVLDFGCGSGRMLRQFAPEAEQGEFWGCDLDVRSIEWLRENLSPPFNVFESSEAPGLPQGDGFFDLIYAFSVYTHFTANWAGWLLEHHRVLADGGLLFATFLGEGMLEPLTGEKWDEDQIGMNPLLHGYPWDLGGPIAINSPWWIRAHWGRAFDIVELRPVLERGIPSHGIVLARKRATELSEDDLTRLEPGEPREIRALLHHAKQLVRETINLRAAHDLQANLLENKDAVIADKEARIEVLERELTAVVSSRSWKLTEPLRSARRRASPRPAGSSSQSQPG